MNLNLELSRIVCGKLKRIFYVFLASNNFSIIEFND